MRLLILIMLVLTALPVAAGELFVAKSQVGLRTKSALFSYPVEAQRGEVWEVVTLSKSKVVLTFGPDDYRRAQMTEIGIRTLPKYKLSREAFDASFVEVSVWPDARRTLAIALKNRLPALDLDSLERIVDGDVWVGMPIEAAQEAVGSRILQRETTETIDGESEWWSVGALSTAALAELTAVKYVDAGGEGSLRDASQADREGATRMKLTFQRGKLIEITRM